MLILVLIDVQYMQNVGFSFDIPVVRKFGFSCSVRTDYKNRKQKNNRYDATQGKMLKKSKCKEGFIKNVVD